MLSIIKSEDKLQHCMLSIIKFEDKVQHFMLSINSQDKVHIER